MLEPQTHLAQPLAPPGASGPRQAAVLTLPPSTQSIAPCPWPLPLPPQPRCQPASCPASPPPLLWGFTAPRDPAPSLGPEWKSGVQPWPQPWWDSDRQLLHGMGAGCIPTLPWEPTCNKLALPGPLRRCRRAPQEGSSPSLWCPGHQDLSNPPFPCRSAHAGCQRTEEG